MSVNEVKNFILFSKENSYHSIKNLKKEKDFLLLRTNY